MKTLSWVVLSGLGGLLGPSRAFLGWSWEAPGAPWEAPGAPRGDPKSIKKVDPKLDSKTGRIATEKMAQTLRLPMFQSLMRLSGTQMQPPQKAIKTAFDMISSYIYIYICVYMWVFVDWMSVLQLD